MKTGVNEDILKKFRVLLDKAVGYDTLRSFCDKCEVNPIYVENFLDGKNPNVPNKRLLTKIAQNSQGRVIYEELSNLFYIEDETSKEDMDLTAIRKGDILWVDLGVSEGSEQAGLRPTVCIQNNLGNRYSPTIIVASITSQISKAKLPTHVEIKKELGLSKDSVVLLEQIRTVDKKAKIKGYIGHCDIETMKRINYALKISLGMDTWIDEMVMFSEQHDNEDNNKDEHDLISSFLKLMPQAKESFFNIFKKNKKIIKA